jgi:hypothetical protein
MSGRMLVRIATDVFARSRAAVLPSNTSCATTLTLDLNRDTEAGPGTGSRFELRVVVRIPQVGATTTAPAFCTIVPSLEIFDGHTGKTLVVVTTTNTMPGFQFRWGGIGPL